MSPFKKLLVCLCLFYALTSNALQCVVVSGLKKDHNRALEAVPTQISETENKIKTKCTTYDSYKSLLADKKVQLSKEPLLLIQAAHGGNSGAIACDGGYVSAEEVFQSIRKLSQKRKVSAFLDSCTSGSLMQKKLLSDEEFQKDSSIDNLCLVTSSLPNSVAYGERKDFYKIGLMTSLISQIANPTTHSPIDVMVAYGDLDYSLGANSKQYSNGLISSLPWRESGAVKFMVNHSNEEGLRFLHYVSQKTKYCDSEKIKKYTNSCAPRKETDLANIHMNTPKVLSKINQFSPLPEHPEEIAFMSEVQKKNLDLAQGLRGLVNYLQKPRTILEVQRAMDQFTSSSGFKKFKSNFHPLLYSDHSHETMKKIMDLFDLDESLIYYVKEAYQSDQSVLNNVMTHENRELTFGLLYQNKDTKPVCDEELFANSLKGFVQGSLKGHTYLDPLDARRAKACENFKF